ncbi:MAG: cysteine desulfurase NifS [Desulfobacterales bacterium]
MNPVVYLDNNATTRVDPEVLEAMLPFFCERYGNPSSMHAFGGSVAAELRRAREAVARLIGASPEEIVFTSGATESNNTAIHAAIEAFPQRRHLVTSRVEHPAVKNVCERLSRRGYRVTFVPVDGRGRLDLDFLFDHLGPDTALVSLMWANNETGVIFPIEEVAPLVRSRGILFHTDAVQAAGKLPIDVGRTEVDFLSLSGHKMHGPKGIGVLYVRRGTSFSPLIVGGHQERGRRAGTENTAAIVGLGRAAELARRHLAEGVPERMRRLRDRLERGILERIPRALVNGDPSARLPNTLNVSFEFVEGEAILLLLNEHGICASSGSACTSGSLEPSHVLRAMGVPFTAAHGSIRFSLSRFTTEEEIDRVLAVLPGIIARLRELSPFWKESAPACTREFQPV